MGKIQYFVQTLLILALTVMLNIGASYAQAPRAPTPSCTNCTTPTGGSHGDGNGNILCPDCFIKKFPQGGTLNPSQGVIVPSGHGGGGGAGGTYCSSCHQ